MLSVDRVLTLLTYQQRRRLHQQVLVGLMELSDKEGNWVAIVTLKPGRYRYKFLINETHWVLDPGNARVVDDGRGGKANLLIIP